MNEHIRKRGGKTTLLALQEAADAKRLAETITVLTQPHRRGDSSELCESALGRFVMAYKCGRETYEGGIDYMMLTYRWRLATGIPVPRWVREEFGGSGGELDLTQIANLAEAIAEWRKKLDECEGTLKRVGSQGYSAANAMLLDGVEPSWYMAGLVKNAIHQLAITLGRFPY